jgi:hypothetical protein
MSRIELDLSEFSPAFQHKIKAWMEKEGVMNEITELETIIDLGMQFILNERIHDRELKHNEV